ncbi:response regulator transcription factor [Pedobacter hartonius]|uniref:Helix-turn-helix domain-containing protein n=1 Tax=Pedobacter hartonius TaxID=425514 RepID=A0A1H4H819_9SPHI|nr:response regulator [Pedobacter hartonius]SEB17934.1 Helix-turn-helix domain-containing protein [Pedobacter hartonius]
MEKNMNLENPLKTSEDLKPVILLVDDQEDILEFIADDLSDTYQVLVARNGIEALEHLRQENIQLVVSDVIMPEMNGFELCEKIKSDLEFSHIPVILLIAKNSLQSKIEGLELGADVYVEKPFSPEFLQVQISSLIKNRNKIRAYFGSSPLIHIKSMGYSKADELFLGKLQETIHRHLDNPDLDVEHLAENMNISRPTLYRKIKSISDLSPNDFINLARLKKGAQLLNDGILKIYEISEMIGYRSPTNFGRNFFRQFGMSPSDYVNSKQAEKRNLA